MTVATSSDASSTADREIVTTRLINAPRELVFAAWTDPVHIGEWWGPNGFTTKVEKLGSPCVRSWRRRKLCRM